MSGNGLVGDGVVEGALGETELSPPNNGEPCTKVMSKGRLEGPFGEVLCMEGTWEPVVCDVALAEGYIELAEYSTVVGSGTLKQGQLNFTFIIVDSTGTSRDATQGFRSSCTSTILLKDQSLRPPYGKEGLLTLHVRVTLPTLPSQTSPRPVGIT